MRLFNRFRATKEQQGALTALRSLYQVKTYATSERQDGRMIVAFEWPDQLDNCFIISSAGKVERFDPSAHPELLPDVPRPLGRPYAER